MRVRAAVCLRAGANDLGGTLMNESITRAAGARHREEMPPAAMRKSSLRLAGNRDKEQRFAGNFSAMAPSRRHTKHLEFKNAEPRSIEIALNFQSPLR
jgi:FO synthase